ncbi:Hypothetical predicted protein, partial [Paramuricea clavata]
MGRNAKIRGVDYVSGGPKSIIIFITISESVDVIDCWLESPKDRIRLGIPTNIVNNWFHTYMSWMEWMEEEREMPEEMQAEAEMWEVLCGQTDEISDMFEGLVVPFVRTHRKYEERCLGAGEKGYREATEESEKGVQEDAK